MLRKSLKNGSCRTTINRQETANSLIRSYLLLYYAMDSLRRVKRCSGKKFLGALQPEETSRPDLEILLRSFSVLHFVLLCRSQPVRDLSTTETRTSSKTLFDVTIIRKKRTTNKKDIHSRGNKTGCLCKSLDLINKNHRTCRFEYFFHLHFFGLFTFLHYKEYDI